MPSPNTSLPSNLKLDREDDFDIYIRDTLAFHRCTHFVISLLQPLQSHHVTKSALSIPYIDTEPQPHERHPEILVQLRLDSLFHVQERRLDCDEVLAIVIVLTADFPSENKGFRNAPSTMMRLP